MGITCKQILFQLSPLTGDIFLLKINLMKVCKTQYYSKTKRNSKCILLLIFFSLFFVNITIAQIKISGTIVDNNKKPIEFANIYLQSLLEEKTIIGATSDINGHFKLEIDLLGDYKIWASFIGYEDYSKEINIINSKTVLEPIVLQKGINNLEEITVVASRDILEKKDDRLVFNVSRSPLKNGYDGVEIMRRTPNVFIGIDGEILMRNEVATIMINGRIINLKGEELNNYINNLRSDNIERIEVQENVTVQTDGESSGGIINIILKAKVQGVDITLLGDYTFRGENYDKAFGGINFNYGRKLWNVYGFYNYVGNDRYNAIKRHILDYNTSRLVQTDLDWTMNEHRHNYQLGFVIEPNSKQTIGVEVFGTKRDYPSTENGNIHISENESELDSGNMYYENDRNYDLNNITVNYGLKLDTIGTNIKLFLDYAQHDFISNNLGTSEYNTSFFQAHIEHSQSEAKTNIFTTQLDFEYPDFKKFKLKSGLKFTFTERQNGVFSETLTNNVWIENNQSSAFNYDEQISAIYVLLSRKINKNFLELGLRLENTKLEKIDFTNVSSLEQNYLNWLPSVYFSRAITPESSVSISYNKKLRRPAYTDLSNYILRLNDFSIFQGNPDLQPEYIHKAALSYQQKPQTASIYYIVRTGVNYQHKDILDGVTYSQRRNGGEESEVGIEYNRNSHLYNWWFIKGNARIFQRKYNQENRELFRRTSGQIDISNNFKINETTNFELSGFYVSTYEKAIYKLLGYYSVDLMLQKSFFNKKLMSRIYITDVFNMLDFKNIRYFDGFETSHATKPKTRTIRLWLSYRFSKNGKVKNKRNVSKNDTRKRL